LFGQSSFAGWFFENESSLRGKEDGRLNNNFLLFSLPRKGQTQKSLLPCHPGRRREKGGDEDGEA